MASIKEQIAALKLRFETLQGTLKQQAAASTELRRKLAKLNETIDLIVGAEEKASLLMQQPPQGNKAAQPNPCGMSNHVFTKRSVSF